MFWIHLIATIVFAYAFVLACLFWGGDIGERLDKETSKGNNPWWLRPAQVVATVGFLLLLWFSPWSPAIRVTVSVLAGIIAIFVGFIGYWITRPERDSCFPY